MGKSTKQDELRPKRRRVRIDVGGQVSHMDVVASHDPSIKAVVLPELEYDATEAEEGGPLGYREVLTRMKFHDMRLDDRNLVFSTGFVPRIVRLLRERGWVVNVVDHRDYGTKHFAIDKQYFRRLHGEDRRLAEAVLREPVGQIEVKNFTDLIESMRTIIELYPKARVLIPVASMETARKIRIKLDAAAMSFAVRIVGKTWPKMPPRCMVCTFASINTCIKDAWDIILLPDAVRSAGDAGVKAIAQFHGPYDQKVWRVYGFLQPRSRLGRRARIRLEAIAGDVIYRRPPERAQVGVLWLPIPAPAKIPARASALEFKRKAYWHNDRRNDYIAAAARAFMRQDLEKLRKYGVPFEGDKPALRHVPHPKLVLLAASTEQARELKKRLPEWEVLSAVPGRETAEEESQGKIVTEMWATREGLDADVVIRAGGGSGTLCLKGLPPALEGEERRDGLVVDFEDGFDVRAVREAKRRMSGYEALGWRPLSEQKTVYTEPPQR